LRPSAVVLAKVSAVIAAALVKSFSAVIASVLLKIAVF
jgi:hypothetical protein